MKFLEFWIRFEVGSLRIEFVRIVFVYVFCLLRLVCLVGSIWWMGVGIMLVVIIIVIISYKFLSYVCKGCDFFVI